MPFSAALLAAALTVSPAQVKLISNCVTQISGIAAPVVLPRVIRVDDWTLTGEGICCDQRGQYARAGDRAESYYKWRTRTIILSLSADNVALAHELASDSYRLHHGWIVPTEAQLNEADTWAYTVSRRIGFEDGCRP